MPALQANDTQIKVIGSMKPEMCTKMLRNSTEKLRARFSETKHGYSMVKIAHLDDSFSEFFEVEASPVEGQSLQPKNKKKRKGKVKKKQEKPKSLRMYIGYFPLKNHSKF